MDAAPPFFAEETIASSSGSIDFKVFYDRAFSSLHVYAAQSGGAALSDLSGPLCSIAQKLFSSKVYSTCFLSSQEDLALVRSALLKYSSFCSN